MQQGNRVLVIHRENCSRSAALSRCIQINCKV